jgi:hypothetical protein
MDVEKKSGDSRHASMEFATSHEPTGDRKKGLDHRFQLDGHISP